MLILTLRSDKPEAELALYNDRQRLGRLAWPAHRQLAESIHLKIKELLKAEGKTLQDIEGLVIFEGPGSFTGLRIGFSVANALADSLAIPIIAAVGSGWQRAGIAKLLAGQGSKLARPDYGAPPKTTAPKK